MSLFLPVSHIPRGKRDSRCSVETKCPTELLVLEGRTVRASLLAFRETIFETRIFREKIKKK
jgi:hypothetical protein